MCTWRAHTNTANILSYSFSHSVKLPLCFTGVVLHHLCKTVTFTQNNLDTVYIYSLLYYTDILVFFFSAKAVPGHYFDFLMFQNFILFFICFSPRQRLYDCVYHSKHIPFTKGMVIYFLKKLPVPKNSLAAWWLVSRMQPLDMLASCLTSLTAYEGNCHYLGLYCRVQNSL